MDRTFHMAATGYPATNQDANYLPGSFLIGDIPTIHEVKQPPHATVNSRLYYFEVLNVPDEFGDAARRAGGIDKAPPFVMESRTGQTEKVKKTDRNENDPRTRYYLRWQDFPQASKDILAQTGMMTIEWVDFSPYMEDRLSG